MQRTLFRLVKSRERRTRDLDQMRCIRDEEGKVLLEETDIKWRWKDTSISF